MDRHYRGDNLSVVTSKHVVECTDPRKGFHWLSKGLCVMFRWILLTTVILTAGCHYGQPLQPFQQAYGVPQMTDCVGYGPMVYTPQQRVVETDSRILPGPVTSRAVSPSTDIEQRVRLLEVDQGTLRREVQQNRSAIQALQGAG